jgi:hypothetical protein
LQLPQPLRYYSGGAFCHVNLPSDNSFPSGSFQWLATTVVAFLLFAIAEKLAPVTPLTLPPVFFLGGGGGVFFATGCFSLQSLIWQKHLMGFL